MKLIIFTLIISVSIALISPCNHPIYCQGDILATVQQLRIFKDQKEFVDMPLKFTIDQTIANWKLIQNKKDVNQIKSFLLTNFLPAGSDCEAIQTEDWQESPDFLKYIKEPSLISWGKSINDIWKQLTRQFVIDEASSSLLSTPYPFVVPGGRFREFYYWDSLWTVEGLLHSGMIKSSLNMVRNFVHFIEKYGYIPNGARVYFLGRSQPPITVQLVKKLLAVLDTSESENLLREVYPALVKEYEFFVKERGVQACKVLPTDDCQTMVFHYDSASDYPRPESYMQDVELAEDQQGVFRNVASACESGWDFSSRWFENPYDMHSIRTTDILPVDLNTLMALNSKDLAQYSKQLGYESIVFERQYENLSEILDKHFYNQDGQWYDYIISKQEQHIEYYPSNYFPLLLKQRDLPMNVYYGLKKLITQFKGGLPTSLKNTTQQWDFPNSWAPLNHLIIQALKIVFKISLNNRIQQGWDDLAYELAQNWITNAYCSFQNSIELYGEGYMFEKYNAVDVGQPGSGGEYGVQFGFGWTNGVAITLLREFGQDLKQPKC